MVKKCWHCETNYIENTEEVCIDCAIFFAEENEYDHASEMIVELYGDNEFLNEKGASFVSRY